MTAVPALVRVGSERTVCVSLSTTVYVGVCNDKGGLKRRKLAFTRKSIAVVVAVVVINLVYIVVKQWFTTFTLYE